MERVDGRQRTGARDAIRLVPLVRSFFPIFYIYSFFIYKLCSFLATTTPATPPSHLDRSNDHRNGGSSNSIRNSNSNSNSSIRRGPNDARRVVWAICK